MFLHITDARYVGKYKIEVVFNDGKKGVADLSPVITRGVFQKLKDESLFSKVTVDRELDTITWPCCLDLAPEYVYFLTFEGDQKLQEKFKDWGYA